MKIHLEWGAEALRVSSNVAVIVDCLSFTTGVSVACVGGAKIYPYLLRQNAQKFAEKLGVQCAGLRKEGGFSLSPQTLQGLGKGEELVLPSPNGSTLTLSAKAEIILGGAIRNASSVADYLNNTKFNSVVFVAAGERWTSVGSLRPAYEDLIACGAIISMLDGLISPEAQASVDAYNGIKNDIFGAMLACQSGIELSEHGWRSDVEWASKLSCDECVPKLEFLSNTYRDIGMKESDGLVTEFLNRPVGYFCCA